LAKKCSSQAKIPVVITKKRPTITQRQAPVSGGLATGGGLDLVRDREAGAMPGGGLTEEGVRPDGGPNRLGRLPLLGGGP
jgi:hypothetical protein